LQFEFFFDFKIRLKSVLLGEIEKKQKFISFFKKKYENVLVFYFRGKIAFHTHRDFFLIKFLNYNIIVQKKKFLD
jgi:hypothetical protein